MRLRPAGDVAWVEETDPAAEVPDVVVARVPQGPPMALRGSAALIWLAAAVGGTSDEVVARVAEASGQPPAVVEDDVRVLLDDLIVRGLLVLDGDPRVVT